MAVHLLGKPSLLAMYSPVQPTKLIATPLISFAARRTIDRQVLCQNIPTSNSLYNFVYELVCSCPSPGKPLA